MTRLRIAIDARLSPKAPGGVLQVVLGVAHGLSQIERVADERYSFMVKADYDGWLDAYLGSGCDVIRMKPEHRWRKAIGGLAGRSGLFPPSVPKSDGVLEQSGFDGVHFLLPMGFRTNVPSVYHIHDLQHLHYPQNLAARTRSLRDAVFTTLSQQASRVLTMTNWGRDDLVEKLGTPRGKTAVVPWGSVLSAYATPDTEQLERLRQELDLNEPFAYFPAKAYPHKNHLRLLTAIAALRDRGLRIPLVLTGAKGAETAAIDNRIHALGLQDLVRHLGFVQPEVVVSLFRLCRCLVFPSLFEGWGLPISEAMSIGTPITCANATCLPEVAQDAAVYFDPLDVESIADGLRRAWSDEAERSRLRRRASEIAELMTWKSTASQLCEHYRELFGAKSNKVAA